jgi:hypothetical protein
METFTPLPGAVFSRSLYRHVINQESCQAAVVG